jgi:uncharacterized protein (TIGR02118 family)
MLVSPEFLYQQSPDMKSCRWFYPLFVSLVMLCGWRGAKSTQSALPSPGLVKVAIMYPAGKDKTFDMDYYEKVHMPMMAGFLGKNLQFYEIDKGISGRTPTDPLPYMAIGYFYCQDLAAYNSAVAQHIDAILKDIPRYTNIQPVVQISEVRQVVGAAVSK